MFDHLFSPLNLGPVRLRNRICFSGHRTHFARKGRLTDRHIAYHQRRARGGCGLIVFGELSLHLQDRPWQAMVETYAPHAAKDFQRLTAAVHEWDCPIFARLNHHGFQSGGGLTRHAVWGPSAVADIEFGETAKAMEPEEIQEIVTAFARAATRAREGGFDGLEIDMGPRSLLRQFLSPLSNHREDEYGGVLENRMRFPLAVQEAVRQAVGDGMAVGIRLCADEQFWGAIEPTESREMARIFETKGQADFIEVSIGTYYNLHLQMPTLHTPCGFTVEAAARIKSAVSIPVMAAQHIDTPQRAEGILQDGKADAVGLIRNLICDPDWPIKARDGRLEDIRRCVRGNQGCVGRIAQGKELHCVQNPEVGAEAFAESQSTLETATTPTGRKKRILVAGAGPAGLSAALAIREKGHSPVVYERSATPGGQIRLLQKGAGREGMGEIIRYLIHRLEQLRVPIVTETEVTPSLVNDLQPDAVVAATGSVPVTRPVPGDYGPPSVQTVWDVLTEKFPAGPRVLFVDENGGHHATATADRLADQGKSVHMITSELFVGMDLAPLGDLYLTRQRLLQKGVTFQPDVVVTEIRGQAVMAYYRYTRDPLVFEGYDTIVLDMGNAAADGLYRQLKGRVPVLFRVGDCVAPRDIGMAVLEGRRVGELL